MAPVWLPVSTSLIAWFAVRQLKSIPRALQGSFAALLILIVLLSALVLDPEHDPLAALAVMFLVGFTAMKLYDLAVGLMRGNWPGLAEHLAFMVNPCTLVQRRIRFEPDVSPIANLGRMALGVLQMTVGFLLLKGFWLIDYGRLTFWLEHGIKSIGFFLCVIGLFRELAGAYRLLGFTAREPSDRSMLPPTPADFWRRYNRVVHQFLLEDVFKVVGGRRWPMVGVMSAFLISGLLHEYLFSLPAGRFQGYQITFFLIQGLAVAATMRVRPKGPLRIGWIAGTLAFNIVTSTLFLASLHEIIPIYSNPLPGWLAPA